MKIYCLILIFFSLSIRAQFIVEGVVKEDITNKTIPFASILINNKFKTLSDIDGKFILENETKFSSFQVKYNGYEPLNFEIKDKKFFLVHLKPNNLVKDNNNRVTEILNKVVANRNQNNPQKKLKSFEFKTYNKLIVTANPDSIVKKIDSVFVIKRQKKVFSKIDSSAYKFKKIIEDQHLFQIEKVSQYQFKKNKLKETVVGLKMS
ncbi:MAG: carboxypeptidase-like regulatory domain-containing protein, partial [Flavobacterium sp.]|nr:carboxypeptidase-like regulatory domain-containing protein [Flavobacterium sp.]